MSTEVRVPALGESVTEATIATWFKKAGDTVAVDEMLCELETDKVTVEVPSPAAGVLAEIVAEEGATVEPNALLAQIDESAKGADSGRPSAQDGTGQDGGKGAKQDAGQDAKQVAGQDAKQDKAAVRASAETPEEKTEMSGNSVDVMVPALGESVTEATVATWFKKVGDQVAADEMLCELETDKVSVEVPSPTAGVLAEIVAEEGATVDAKARLAVITEGAAGGGSESSPAPAAPEEKATDAGPEEMTPREDVEDAPSARKAMAEKGVGRGQVTASGRDGRVMKEDVARAGSPAAAPAPKAAPQSARAPSAPQDAEREERVRMTRLRQTIARRLKDAQNSAAMLTTYNEADMSAIMELRGEYKEAFEKKHKVKLGFMSFFVKACCHALQEVPEVNAEIDGTDVVYKHYVNMGVAVGTPNGLVVPVVKDADRKGFAEIEKEIGELGTRARDGKLTMAQMQGGTFTISNGGVYGSLMSSPILNPPQSGILGMHKIQDRPVVVGGQIVIRPMMYLALSYDHRIVDGKGAVTFLVRVKEALEDPRRLLMDL